MISAEFMDIFGVIGFVILLITGISLLKKEKFKALIIVIISGLGLIVDLYIVISRFLIR